MYCIFLNENEISFNIYDILKLLLKAYKEKVHTNVKLCRALVSQLIIMLVST